MISLKDKQTFIGSLSTFLSSGISINLALSDIYKNTQNSSLRKKIYIIQQEIENGKSVFDSFKKSNLLDSQALTLIQIGEGVGRINYFLKVLEKNIERRYLLNTKIKSALIYPAFVLFTSLLVIVFISYFLFPKIITLYTDLKVEVPIVLRLFNYVSHVETLYLYTAIFGFVILIYFLYYLLFVNNRSKILGECLILSIPIYSEIIKISEQVSTSLYISEMLLAGINIFDTFKLIENNSKFILFKKFYSDVSKNISNGKTIEQSFYASKYNPYTFTQKSLIFSAEKSGNLEKIFRKIGNDALKELNTKTKNLYSLLEPILLIFIFIIVLSISVSVIYPIYNLFGKLSSTDYGGQSSNIIIVPTSSPTLNMVPTIIPTNITYVEILNTPTGYLNVREKPSQNSIIILKAKPGEKYIVIDSYNKEWLNIRIEKNDFYKSGYVNKNYAKFVE